jgi:hypothetical protein
MGTEMVTMGVPTLQFAAVPPKACSTPTDHEGDQEDDQADQNGGRGARWLATMTDWRPDAQAYKVLFPTRLQRVPIRVSDS